MNEAQKALADFNRYLDSRGARVHPDEESFCEGFERAYAAATAERDAILDGVLMVLAANGFPTPERTYKLDGGWALAYSDLKRAFTELRAERDRLARQVARMTEAMGEEWPTATKEDDPAWYYPPACPECYRSPDVGHEDYCERGRFFAALASAEAK